MTSLTNLPRGSLRGKRWSGYLSWRRRRRFVHRADVLAAVTEAVRREDPVQILVTGDLVHVGLPVEIDAAVEWLQALGPPERVMLVPGNHDVYAGDSWAAVSRAWEPYLWASGAGEGDCPFPVERRLGEQGGTLSLVGLSSAVTSPLFMAYGRLGEAQLQRLDTALQAAGGFRCVLVHHPPLPAMSNWRKGLLDANRLEQVLVRRGAELVLHGHVHRNVERRGPGHTRIFGTASASSAGHDPAAYRCFDVSAEADHWRVEMRLVVMQPSGATRTAARESWTVPFRRASAA